MKRRITVLVMGLGLGLASHAVLAQNIKIGHFGSPGNAFDQGVELFIQKLEELSEGDITATNYPSGQLGNESQQVASLRGGLQEILITSSTNLIRYNPLLQLIDLPFLFEDDAETDEVLLGTLGRGMLDGLDGRGMYGLTFWDNGFRDLSNSQRPIEKLEDFQGLDFRVIGEPIYIDTFRALGANPVPMPFPEVYSALETNTVDGQDNPLLTVRDMHFYEVQDYLTHSKHAYSAMVVLAGEPFWNRLTDAQKAVIQQAAIEAGQEQRRIMRDEVAHAKDYLAEEGGMTVSEFAPESLEGIRMAVQPVIENHVTEEARPIYEQITQMLEQLRSS